jgi:putative acetyltransferase
MIEVRTESKSDYPQVYQVNKQAFGGREAEPKLVETIRQSPGFIPELSLVAVEEGQVVGHILFSLIEVETSSGRMEAISLAPMAVLPRHQNQRIGSLLVREGLERVRQLGYPFVIVLGHPDFYPRFGFSASLTKKLECPWGDCGEAWMAYETVPGSLQGVEGKVIYPPAFGEV